MDETTDNYYPTLQLYSFLLLLAQCFGFMAQFMAQFHRISFLEAKAVIFCKQSQINPVYAACPAPNKVTQQITDFLKKAEYLASSYFLQLVAVG